MDYLAGNVQLVIAIFDISIYHYLDKNKEYTKSLINI